MPTIGIGEVGVKDGGVLGEVGEKGAGECEL